MSDPENSWREPSFDPEDLSSDPLSTGGAKEEAVRAFIASRFSLQAFIEALVRDPYEADDIFQETWLVFSRVLDGGEVIRDVPRWCRAVAKKRILRYWEKQRGSKVVFNSDLVEVIDQIELAFNERSSEDLFPREEALRQCLAALPEKSRQLIQLKYEKRCSMELIARHLSKSTSSVIKALLRLRRALATCVEGKVGKLEA
jgi:RNA polymerase sigma-70 factor (ECF subfamily)